MPIISVSGKTRRGKTSFVLAQLLPELIGIDCERYVNACNYLQELQKRGMEISLPPENHTISANIDFINKYPNRRAYEVNGFELGVPNDFQKTIRMLPYGTYVLDEAQRYYMQDDTKKLPPWVLMMFQISGQYYIKFILISQRAMWIHKDIRSITDKFIYILDCFHIFKDGRKLIKTDKFIKCGKLISTTWNYIEFDDDSELECYLKAPNVDKKLYGKRQKFTFKGDIREHYDTNNFKSIFEDTTQDFRYYGANIYDFMKPEEWRKQVDTKNKQSGGKNEK